MRTEAGAKRYKQPIGSIIIVRGGPEGKPGSKALNLAHMSDHDLTELMEDSHANRKNPQVYEAAFTEWARRQPDLEPVAEPPWPDDMDAPDDADTVRVELLQRQYDAALDEVRDPSGELSDAEFDAVIEDATVLNELIDFERRMAAIDVPDDPADVDKPPPPDADAPAVPVDPKREKRWKLHEQAQEMADRDGIDFYEALAGIQGKSVDRVYRDEFLAMAADKWGSTNFQQAAATAHAVAVGKWIDDAEADINGYLINDKARAKGLVDHDLWLMNDMTADHFMSGDAVYWFQDRGGRVTQADLVDLINRGVLSTEPDDIQQAFAKMGGGIRADRAAKAARRPKKKRKTKADRLREAMRQAEADAKAEEEAKKFGDEDDAALIQDIPGARRDEGSGYRPARVTDDLSYWDGLPPPPEREDRQDAYGQVFSEQGWDGPMTVLDDDEFEAAATASNEPRVYRGVHPVGDRTAAEVHREFIEQHSAWIGEGVRGSGWYTTTKVTTTFNYSPATGIDDVGDSVIEMAFRPEARICQGETDIPSDVARTDWSLWAAKNGYDAMRTMTPRLGESYYVLLNRSSAVVRRMKK